MNLITFLSIFIGLNFSQMRMDKPAYQLFDAQAQKQSYENLKNAALEADIIFFGELHNNPICHWLQRELSQDLYAQKGSQLVLGAEMFEADDQVILDEYLAGLLSVQNLGKEAKLWNNFDTDYRPLLDLAKENKLKFIATNVPRRYASLVSKQGLEALKGLSEEAKNWMAPLPIQVDLELKAYADMLKMMGGHQGMGNMKAENFAYAQAIKDATMAHFILENFQKGKTFIHFNGSYHSDNYQSIIWYLKQKNPDLKILSISSVEQTQMERLEADYVNRADFILTIPQSMTKTY